MHRNNRRLRKQQNAMQDLSMTPLIDTALTLLIIFMVATPVLQNAIKVTLPKGNSKEVNSTQQDEVIVFIDKDMHFYLNKEKLEKTDLIARIQKSIGDQERTVYVKADAAVSYGTVIELVDDIKFIGGIKYVALATQKHSQATSSLG